MSRAFVKESEDGAGDDLPDRPISPHRNLVTPKGLALIDAELARLTAALGNAPTDDRAQRNVIARDLRYWRARRATAELVSPPKDVSKVQFGTTVTIARGGKRETWRIVGEDEADPATGSLPYVAPLARALIGKEPGDIARLGSQDIEIIDIV
jgi:transcription elongation GreA/GreB family factor